MIVKMSDPVLVDGEVTTLAALADAGRLIFREVEVTCRKRLGERRTRIAYFADLLDTGEGWEIGRLAYLSRTKQPTGRLARRSSAAARTVAEALEVVRAKSARWASTFDPVDGTVLCRRREYARRADGTIVGLSLGRAVARTVEVRRPVVEVAAELQAQAAAAARRVADLAVARAEQAARWRAQAASLRLQADAAEAELPGLEHLPIAVRAAAASQVALLRAESPRPRIHYLECPKCESCFKVPKDVTSVPAHKCWAEEKERAKAQAGEDCTRSGPRWRQGQAGA